MSSSIEKKLNIDIIITLSVTIFAIILAIVSLNGVINKIVDFKNGNMQIAINVLDIVKINTEKESIIRDVVLNHDDKNYVKKKSSEYNMLQKKMNFKMSFTEKLIGEKSIPHKIGDMYLNLYKVIVKSTESEKYILKQILNDNFANAIREFKIKNKRYNTDIDNISNNFYSMVIEDTQETNRFEKGHFLIIIAINILAFLLFIILLSLTLSKISKEISNLHNAAKNIHDGKLETPVEINANDEIGELGRALDRLRQSFNKSKKMISRRNI